MKYLKKFDTHSDYETFTGGTDFILPNVSYCVNENEVHYNPYEITHEYVDLGLPSGTLWATENIKDANGNELYFAWGETQGYTSGQVGTDKYFAFDGDYKYGPFNVNDRVNWGMTKYNETDGKTVLEPEDDAATANWGSNWKIPTEAQFRELTANTTTAWTQVNGVNGLLCTSTANTLFFPAVGYAVDGEFYSFGTNSQYLSSSLGSVTNCRVFRFGNDVYCTTSGELRYTGSSVRPVRVSN